jgi:hypothetical protein
MTPQNFPLLFAALSDRDRARVAEAVDVVAKAVEAGEIANVVYNDVVKYRISRAFEDAWKRHINEVYTYGGKWQTLSAAENELENALSRPQAHTIPGLIKKVQKTKLDTEFTRAVMALLNELAPLGAAVVSLKDKVVKRQPKAPEDVKAKYLSPRASGTAAAEVQKLLMEITEKAKAELLTYFTTRFNRILDGYRKALAENPKLSPSKHVELPNSRYGFKEHDSEKLQLLSDLVARPKSYSDTVVVKDNADEIIAKKAEDIVERLQEQFVVLNLKKLDSIFEGKGNFKTVKVIGNKIDLGGVYAMLRFTFEDGAAFTSKIQAVYVVNQQGTAFFRTPITFHDVLLPGGEKMALPSEEKMNTIFIGKPGK